MYTEKQRETISKNLKELKKYYKERQLDIAQAVNIPESTYSEYVNMSRTPTEENVAKLAARYGITEYELANTEIAFGNNVASKIFVNFAKDQNNLELMFPFIKINNNKDDYLFKEAFKLHHNLFYGNDSDDKDLIKIQRLYRESYNKFKNLDSYANFATLIFLLEACKLNPKIIAYCNESDFLNENEMDYYFKDVVLKRFKKTKKEEKEDNMVIIFKNMIDKMLKKLNKDKRYSDFVQYFIMLEYIFGFGNLELSEEYNHLVGGEMLDKLYIIGNPYVKDCLLLIANIMNFD